MATTPSLDDVLAEGARLYGAGQTAAAARVYAKALALAPDNPTARLRHALAIWHGEDRTDEALAEIQSLERDYPQAPVHAQASLILLSLGRTQEAIEAARRTVTADPSFASAWHGLATSTSGDAAKALEAEIAALPSSDWPADKRRDLHFARADLLRKTGELARAFEQTVAANRLDPATWDPAREQRFHELLRTIFTPETMARLQGNGHSDRRMLFVMGMPRSGTTLLERMLGAHPQIASVGETPIVGNLFTQLLGHGGNTADGVLSLITPATLEQIGKALIAGVEQRLRHSDARIIIDKMPPNILFAPFLRLILPGAKLLHLRRHPLDTCLSCFEARFTFGLPYASDLGSLARAWQQYAALSTDWAHLLGEHMTELSYEALVDDPEASLRPLISSLGFEWDGAVLTPRREGTIKTASITQARAPVSTRSVGRWKQLRPQLAPLIDALGGIEQIETRWSAITNR